MRYPLTSDGVFRTFQGEGLLIGKPMVFVRLGGCSVNCEGCDTNYKTHNKQEIREIVEQVRILKPNPWIWITGGEPLDYNLEPLLNELRLWGKIALVTSGRKSTYGYGKLIDFLSVSPHGKPEQLVITRGAQVNLVPSLGGTNLNDWKTFDFSGFGEKWITPYDKDKDSLKECMDWINHHNDWRLGIQAHKYWEIP